jgi:hypothetical protein
MKRFETILLQRYHTEEYSKVDCADSACKDNSLVNGMVKYYNLLDKNLVINSGFKPVTTVRIEVCSLLKSL